jgi:hypothetical protein
MIEMTKRRSGPLEALIAWAIGLGFFGAVMLALLFIMLVVKAIIK